MQGQSALSHVSTPDLVRELFRRIAPPSGRCKITLDGENGEARWADSSEVRIPVPKLDRFDLIPPRR